MSSIKRHGKEWYAVTVRGCSIWRKKRRDYPAEKGLQQHGAREIAVVRQQMRDDVASCTRRRVVFPGALNAPNYTRRARYIRLGEHDNSGEVDPAREGERPGRVRAGRQKKVTTEGGERWQVALYYRGQRTTVKGRRERT